MEELYGIYIKKNVLVVNKSLITFLLERQMTLWNANAKVQTYKLKEVTALRYVNVLRAQFGAKLIENALSVKIRIGL